MENAILYAGIDELNTIKEQVLEFNGNKEKSTELAKEVQRLDKLLASKEKERDEETETTLKKRRAELSGSYQGQLTNLNARNKKIRAKKDKAKDAKVGERITEETAELREENKALITEIKARLKADKTPVICNTTLFYGLFMPKALVEFVIFLAALLLVFLCLPFGVYNLFFKVRFGEIALAVIYLVTIFIFGGLYLVINNKVKERHLETIREVRSLRHQCRKNHRAIKKIRKGIRGDEDESAYGLEQYDDELAENEAEIRRVAEEEKNALNNYDSVTSGQIREEIHGRYQAELESLHSKYEENSKELKKTEDRVQEFALLLSSQYEPYIGKENMSVEKLDRLIARIEKGEAANIGEAIARENGK